MEFLMSAIDMVLHVDRHLVEFAATYGLWIYALLFLIIFLETGVVVTPFLPGDSLLFATGALAAAGVLDIGAILTLLTAAAIIGDNTNYFIGRAVGPRVFTEHSRWLKREHLLRTQRFYEHHGGKAVVMARFVPMVRTFAPFVAELGACIIRGSSRSTSAAESCGCGVLACSAISSATRRSSRRTSGSRSSV